MIVPVIISLLYIWCMLYICRPTMKFNIAFSQLLRFTRMICSHSFSMWVTFIIILSLVQFPLVTSNKIQGSTMMPYLFSFPPRRKTLKPQWMTEINEWLDFNILIIVSEWCMFQKCRLKEDPLTFGALSVLKHLLPRLAFFLLQNFWIPRSSTNLCSHCFLVKIVWSLAC